MKAIAVVAGVLLAGGCTVVVRPQEACTTHSTATGGVDVAAAYERRREQAREAIAQSEWRLLRREIIRALDD